MNSQQIVTDALGFRLDVTITIGDFDTLGSHHTFENYDTKKVDVGIPHRINVKSGLSEKEARIVAAHEAYHLFASIRHLITTDEETETETFGGLVGAIYEMAVKERINALDMAIDTPI